MQQPPVIAYIALGANLGDREHNIRDALARLATNQDTRVVTVSSLLENPAIGGPPDSPPFLNAVAQVQTTLDAHALLRRLLDIEHQMGRVRQRKWEPRAIDLDLILYGDATIRSHELTVPHPLMDQRAFVLRPLAEVAPEVRHPVLHRTAAELLRELESREERETRPASWDG
ncbi:MAG TPA: 2-amino-4-hydroxy-6-hydroxymethyldihydropteridine diphosphokinase [Tepidisphaeraceae bacterium]|nr:2-amino-4-hydroxy-6-hydroxymethyldihydropteridine diphosphokinase [Tepidisphaeraceae bacterium]